MEYVFLIILDLCIIVLEIFNFKGNIYSIHWYNRIKVINKKDYFINYKFD